MTEKVFIDGVEQANWLRFPKTLPEVEGATNKEEPNVEMGETGEKASVSKEHDEETRKEPDEKLSGRDNKEIKEERVTKGKKVRVLEKQVRGPGQFSYLVEEVNE